MLQHHLGQSFRGIARNIIGADAASHGEGMSKAREGNCGVKAGLWEKGPGGLVSMWAPTETSTFQGGGALERGHGAPLECLAYRGDTLVATLFVEVEELVVSQAAKGSKEKCQRGR